MVLKIFLLAIAGALGTLSRYGLTNLVHWLNGGSSLWATLAVNLTGCFFAGLLWTLFEHRFPHLIHLQVFVMVGFMGAFTTFSSFILETHHFVRSADWLYAGMNVMLQNILGFTALFAGIVLARFI